jgi:hypothetical protein
LGFQAARLPGLAAKTPLRNRCSSIGGNYNETRGARHEFFMMESRRQKQPGQE